MHWLKEKKTNALTKGKRKPKNEIRCCSQSELKLKSVKYHELDAYTFGCILNGFTVDYERFRFIVNMLEIDVHFQKIYGILSVLKMVWISDQMNA